MTKNKKNLIILFILIILLILFLSRPPRFGRSAMPGALGDEEGIIDGESVTCFDYADNDNDGLFDLDDPDCDGIGMGDEDGDGWINVEEYESGTDVFDPSSHP